MVFPTVFPMNLFQVGIPYLLQRYGLAGDSAVQVMTTRPGGEGWENRGKKWGKTQNHGKMWGKTMKKNNLADHVCVMNFVGVLSHPSLFHKLMDNAGRS